MSTSDYRAIGATTYLCPVPAVLVGCADAAGKPNLITVAWTGVVCSKPPMVSISLKKERYSYGLIRDSGEFTINLVNESMLRAVDFCGVKSGRDLDKFASTGLHALPADALTLAPAVEEAPAYLSCTVKQIIPLGCHDLFLANVKQVNVRDEFFRADGSIDEQAMKLVAYVHGKYRALADELGFFGFSVADDAVLRKRMPKKR